MLNRTALLCAVLAAGLSGALFAAEPAAEIVDVRKIWDAAPHNAFTDLLRHDARWYCVFREGQAHVSPDGASASSRRPTARTGSRPRSSPAIPPTSAMPRSTSPPMDG